MSGFEPTPYTPLCVDIRHKTLVLILIKCLYEQKKNPSILLLSILTFISYIARSLIWKKKRVEAKIRIFYKYFIDKRFFNTKKNIY